MDNELCREYRVRVEALVSPLSLISGFGRVCYMLIFRMGELECNSFNFGVLNRAY
jgi:hypothetical protein